MLESNETDGGIGPGNEDEDYGAIEAEQTLHADWRETQPMVEAARAVHTQLANTVDTEPDECQGIAAGTAERHQDDERDGCEQAPGHVGEGICRLAECSQGMLRAQDSTMFSISDVQRTLRAHSEISLLSRALEGVRRCPAAFPG